MKYNHFDMLPERAFQRVGGRMTLEGGSGGGGNSGTPYYANMDRLYGAQSQAAEYMLNTAMPNIPQYTANSNKMVTEAMDGTLSAQMRERAGNESTATMGAALAANDRSMQRYGMGFSADRLLSEGNKNAIMGAAAKTGAVNEAAGRAEDMKWNRNAGALGQVTGMGMGSMDSIGSAARGYGAAGNAMMGNDMANASGYGKFGAAIAANAFKDGGAVNKKSSKPGLHLAAGGATPSANPWASWQNNNPIQTSQPQGGNSGGGGAMGTIAMGAAPILVGKGMKAGLSAVKGAMAPAKPAADVAAVAGERGGGAMANGAEPTAEIAASTTQEANAAQAVQAAPEAAAVTPTAEVATTAGADVAGTAATDAAVTAGTDAAVTAGADVAGTAAADAAATAAADAAATAAATAATETAAAAGTAAVAEGAAAGSVAGPVGTAAGLVVGGLIASGALDGMFANGGKVKRKNFKPGGKVSGEGTATSDDVPAWLSDGEHVNNATSVKLAGLDTLEKINNAGLAVRQGKKDAETAKHEIGTAMIERGEELTAGLHLACGGKVGVKMAGGGFLGGNAGIALGSGVDEFNRQRVLGMEQGLYDLKLKLAKPQVDTIEDRTGALRATYKANQAQNEAGLELLPGQTANAKRQQQVTGLGLDTALTGQAGQSLMDGNKAKGIEIMNQSLAAMPGYNGVKVVDVQPAKDKSGVNYMMDDGSAKFVPTQELQRAVGSMKQGDFQAIKDDAGNIFSFNKSTGSTEQKVKGDPNNLPGKTKPADVASAEWLINNGVAKDAKSAWDLVRSSREKTRTDFVLDYVSKNAMPGSDVNSVSKQAGELYDSLRKTPTGAATQDVPASGQTGIGKTGINWQDWASPPQ